MELQSVLMLVLCLLSYGYSNDLVLNLHHRYGGLESANLSDLRAHDLRRHGRMLGAVDFPIGGTRSSTGVGLVLSGFLCLCMFKCWVLVELLKIKKNVKVANITYFSVDFALHLGNNGRENSVVMLAYCLYAIHC